MMMIIMMVDDHDDDDDDDYDDDDDVDADGHAYVYCLPSNICCFTLFGCAVSLTAQLSNISNARQAKMI